MSELISLMWGIIGIVFIFAGKQFIEVCACFLISGVFLGAWELYELRKEFSAKELEKIIKGDISNEKENK